MRKREMLSKYNFIMEFLVFITSLFPKRFHLLMYNIVKNQDNYLALLIRYLTLRKTSTVSGKNVYIGPRTIIRGFDKLEIGDNVSIHNDCYIQATGGIKIGNDVSIAHQTSILTETHIFNDICTNIKDQGIELKETIIEDNVWIGCGCRILAGVTIESGSIIGAGSVVTKNIKENSVVAGVPATLLKRRD